MNNTGKDNLETVLRLREHIRDEKQTEFGILLSEELRLKTQKSDLEEKIRLHTQNWTEQLQTPTVDIDRQIRYSKHQQYLLDQLPQVTELLAICRESLTEKQQELTQAENDVKIVEKLIAKENELRSEQRRRQEQKQLDELAGLEKATEIQKEKNN